MSSAIASELLMRKDDFPDTIKTLYLGGGTPSILSQDELREIMDAVRENYSFSDSAEITLEANPDDIQETNLLLWQSVGFNRLSIGCQTFDDEVLSKLNRIHRSDDSFKAFELARKHGFNNISIDLMFGLPDQTEARWIKDIETALSLKPEHVSAYGLTIEERTVFGNLHKKGALIVPEEEQQAIYYEHMMKMLGEHGYEQYEISNFCLPGYKSKHNSSYWNQEKYLGIGPSAHSFDGENRMWNDANNLVYIKNIEAGQCSFTLEKLSSIDRTNEYIMTGLRTKEGLSLTRLSDEFNYPQDKLTELVDWHIQNRWIEHAGDQIFLTRSGKLLADEITLKFFLN